MTGVGSSPNRDCFVSPESAQPFRNRDTSRSAMMIRASILISFCAATKAIMQQAGMQPLRPETQILRSHIQDQLGSQNQLRLRGGAPEALEGFGQRWADWKSTLRTQAEGRWSELQSGLKQKRLELCPWEEFAIECEEAFTYHQLWVNPCQFSNMMQRAVDTAAKQTRGTAFVGHHFWPTTLFLMAQSKIRETFNKQGTAPPYGSQSSQWFSTQETASARETSNQADVAWVNDNLVSTALQLKDDDSWEPVSDEDGMTIWRKYFPQDTKFAGKNIGAASKFAAVKAKAVIDAPLDVVYDLFLDNSRVKEYNEYCKDVRDLEWLDESTKVTHSFTGRPWSRDFVTRVHYRTVGEDTRVVVSRAEDHPLAEKMGGYTRMEMPIGANIMRRDPQNPSRTEFTLITHVNPGGFASTQFGAAVTNRLSTDSPRQFMSKLSSAARRDQNSPGSGSRQDGLLAQVKKHGGGIGVALGLMTILRRRGGSDDGCANLGESGQMFAPEITASFKGATG